MLAGEKNEPQQNQKGGADKEDGIMILAEYPAERRGP